MAGLLHRLLHPAAPRSATPPLPPSRQDLKAENRCLKEAIATLALAKLQAGSGPSLSSAMVGAVGSAVQLPAVLFATFWWLLVAAWHTAVCMCTTAWWAWAGRAWAVRWMAARAAHAVAPLVSWASSAAISTAQHALRSATTILRGGKRIVWLVGTAARRCAVAAWACAGSCAAGAIRKAARAHAAAHHRVAAVCEATSRRARCAAAASHRAAVTVVQPAAALAKAHPLSCLAAALLALLAAFLLGCLTSSGKWAVGGGALDGQVQSGGGSRCGAYKTGR